MPLTSFPITFLYLSKFVLEKECKTGVKKLNSRIFGNYSLPCHVSHSDLFWSTLHPLRTPSCTRRNRLLGTLVTCLPTLARRGLLESFRVSTEWARGSSEIRNSSLSSSAHKSDDQQLKMRPHVSSRFCEDA